MPGRVRRAMDGGVESKQRYGNTVEVASDGRLEVKAARGGGLKMTKDGLALSPTEAGEMNRPQINRMNEIPFVSTNATLNACRETINALISEMKRTQNMRS
jgi:hypothetical protein